LILGQKKPFGKTFSKITIKVSKKISFWRNWAKREIPCQRRSRHKKLLQISSFSSRWLK